VNLAAFVGGHLVLLAHFQDAPVVHELFDEGTLVLEVVDVVVFELVEEGEFLPLEAQLLSVAHHHLAAEVVAALSSGAVQDHDG